MNRDEYIVYLEQKKLTPDALMMVKVRFNDKTASKISTHSLQGTK